MCLYFWIRAHAIFYGRLFGCVCYAGVCRIRHIRWCGWTGLVLSCFYIAAIHKYVLYSWISWPMILIQFSIFSQFHFDTCLFYVDYVVKSVQKGPTSGLHHQQIKFHSFTLTFTHLQCVVCTMQYMLVEYKSAEVPNTWFASSTNKVSHFLFDTFT